MKPIIDLAFATLGPAFYGLLLAGAVFALLVGIMLLVDGERVLRWNSAMNAWISSRQAMRPLEEPHDVKRVVYRWHKVAGLLVLAGAIYSLDELIFSYRTASLTQAFRGLASPVLLAMLFDALRYLLVAGNLAALAAGLVLCFRPSLLKGIEAWGDRAYSGRKLAKPLDIMRYGPDEFVRARPRLAGALIALGSLFILVSLGVRWV